MIISVILYLISVGILVIFSFIAYYDKLGSKLGFVIMIAIFVEDVILYFVLMCKIVNNPLFLTITAILNRFFLIIFGAPLWIYGLIIVYIFYGFLLTIAIGKKRFPFEEELS